MPSARRGDDRRSPLAPWSSPARALAALLLAAAPVTLLPTPSGAEPSGPRPAARGIRLPAPVHGVDPLTGVNLGLRPDRLLTSTVPGPVSNREALTVSLGPTGAPAAVLDEQHLVIHGSGNYVIRELGPAREAVGLGATVPPVLDLGTVLWQGFSPGRRELAARLRLDPGIEAARLPMRVGISFRGVDGRAQRLTAGAAAPADGTVTVTLTNATTSTRVVPVGMASLRPLARTLDRLREAARRPVPAVPPVADAGLPREVPGHTLGQTSMPVTAPLRVTGTITAPGGAAAVHGPGLTAAPGGVRVAGTLSSAVSFAVAVHRGEAIGLSLDAQPTLDPRTLQPPAPARNWRQWVARRPRHPQRADATALLISAAASAARAAEYSPYLQADTPGRALSTFRYVLAEPAAARPAAEPLRPRPGAIAAASIALLAVIGNAALLRRRL